jgi:hypothetical protein
MTEKERAAVLEMIIAYNTDFAMQDKDKICKIKNKFINDFSVDVTEKPHYVLQLLEKAYRKKNAEDVENILFLANIFNLISKEYAQILMKLLKTDWHCKHEDIVLIFKQLKMPEAVDCLYETSLKLFKYLEYDDFFALPVKCIWALGATNTAKSKEKLKLLAQSSNEIIKENAMKQLERM